MTQHRPGLGPDSTGAGRGDAIAPFIPVDSSAVRGREKIRCRSKKSGCCGSAFPAATSPAPIARKRLYPKGRPRLRFRHHPPQLPRWGWAVYSKERSSAGVTSRAKPLWASVRGVLSGIGSPQPPNHDVPSQPKRGEGRKSAPRVRVSYVDAGPIGNKEELSRTARPSSSARCRIYLLEISP